MKTRLILCLMAVTLLGSTYGQSTYFKNGDSWHYDKTDCGNIQYSLYTVIKDSLIKGKQCKQIQRKKFDHTNTLTNTSYLYCYEENGKMFSLKADTTFRMVFDLSLQAGDFLQIESELGQGTESSPKYFLFNVISVETITIDGVPLKKQKLKCLHPLAMGYTIEVIEKIGCKEGFAFDPIQLLMSGDYTRLRCYESEDISYKAPWFGDKACDYVTTGINEKEDSKIKLYPNPSKGEMVRIDFASVKVQSAQIIDINGRICAEMPKHTQEHWQFSTENYAQGLYFYKITDTSGAIHWGKLVVLKQ